MNIHEGVLNMSFDKKSYSFLGGGCQMLGIFSVYETFTCCRMEKSVEDVDGSGFP
jgi:hypothetical protein